jgi:ribosome maturation factor RimP
VPVGAEAQGLVQALEGVVLPAIEAHGVTLVDLDVRTSGRRAAVRVFVDKPGGVTVDDCARLSEELGDLVDVSGLIPGSYDLEVSSPGLDRELRKDRELRWAVGRLLRVWTREPIEGRRELVGRLQAVSDASLLLAEDGGIREVPRSLLAKVRLEIEPRRTA